MDISQLTNEQKLSNWKKLHKLEAEGTEQGDFVKRNFARKMIAELKPYYNEFAAPQYTNTVATKAQPDHNQSTTTKETCLGRQESEDNHLSFHFYIVSGTQRADVLCDRVFNLWLKSRSLKRSLSATRMQEYYRIIETIMTNLLYCQATGHDGVRFSRCREAYASPSRYRPIVFNERFLAVMDELNSIGVVKQVKGDRWKSNTAQKFFSELSQQALACARRQSPEKSMKTYGLKQSFIAPGKGLLQIQAALSFTPTIHDVDFINEGREVLIMKKGEGSQLLDYRDEEFPGVEKCRKQMQIINQMLTDAGDLLTQEGQSHFDQRRRFLTRRFTYSSTESGGRLWEGFWLSGMKREERPTMLRLNGEPTVELDFSSMIVRLAYIVAEKPAPNGDQYNIPGLDPESRDGIKRALATLLFDSSRNRDRFPKGVAQLFTAKDQKKGWSQVCKAIRSHHYELRAYLDRGLGHYLMYLESQVLINVLLRCALGGVVALPLHDAIVVPRSQMVRAKVFMEYTVKAMFGEEASIPVVAKGLEKGEKKAA